MPCTASLLRAGFNLPQTTRTRLVCVIVAYCRHAHDQRRDAPTALAEGRHDSRAA